MVVRGSDLHRHHRTPTSPGRVTEAAICRTPGAGYHATVILAWETARPFLIADVTYLKSSPLGEGRCRPTCRDTKQPRGAKNLPQTADGSKYEYIITMVLVLWSNSVPHQRSSTPTNTDSRQGGGKKIWGYTYELFFPQPAAKHLPTSKSCNGRVTAVTSM